MQRRIHVSRRLPDRVLRSLRDFFDVTIHDSEWPPRRKELLAAVVGSAGLVTMPTDTVDGELLTAAGPSLRVVANHAVGYDNVDVEEATRRHIVVANTPGVLDEATGEFTLALVLALVRRVAEGDRFLRRREKWALAPTFMLGRALRGRTLGIVGLGRIGSEVARLAAAFGMEVVYTTRTGATGAPYEWLPLADLLARADVVSLHVPLTPETRHLIGSGELRAMRSHAVLVNTSRGAVVDEEALVAALVDGGIAGAALDVFEREPRVHPGLLALGNVVLTPHLASATTETREAMGLLCVEALRAVLIEGRCPPNVVNPEAWRSS
ncbi:MAG: 2-hydroxyacid dehydrogenase [Gaiellaceae bacterium]